MASFSDYLAEQNAKSEQAKTGSFGDYLKANGVDSSKDTGFGQKALNTAQELGRAVYDLPANTKGYIANLAEGSRPLDENNWADQWAKEAQQRSSERMNASDVNDPTLLGTRGDWRNTAQSIPFSAGSMLGGIAGSIVGSPVGPVGSEVGGLVGAGYPAYRADSAMFTRQGLDKFTQDYQAKNSKAPSQTELLAEQERLQPYAQQHGLWEAIPEAVGTRVATKVLEPVMKATGGLGVLKKAAQAGLGILGEEIPTETVTQMGQQRTEANAGLTNETPREFTNAGDWAASAKEVAMPVVQQSLLLGGGAGLARYAYSKSRKPEQDEQPKPTWETPSFTDKPNQPNQNETTQQQTQQSPANPGVGLGGSQTNPVQQQADVTPLVTGLGEAPEVKVSPLTGEPTPAPTGPMTSALDAGAIVQRATVPGLGMQQAIDQQYQDGDYNPMAGAWEPPTSQPYYDGTFNTEDQAANHIAEFELKNRDPVQNSNGRWDLSLNDSNTQEPVQAKTPQQTASPTQDVSPTESPVQSTTNQEVNDNGQETSKSTNETRKNATNETRQEGLLNQSAETTPPTPLPESATSGVTFEPTHTIDGNPVRQIGDKLYEDANGIEWDDKHEQAIPLQGGDNAIHTGVSATEANSGIGERTGESTGGELPTDGGIDDTRRGPTDTGLANDAGNVPGDSSADSGQSSGALDEEANSAENINVSQTETPTGELPSLEDTASATRANDTQTPMVETGVQQPAALKPTNPILTAKNKGHYVQNQVKQYTKEHPNALPDVIKDYRNQVMASYESDYNNALANEPFEYYANLPENKKLSQSFLVDSYNSLRKDAGLDAYDPKAQPEQKANSGVSGQTAPGVSPVDVSANPGTAPMADSVSQKDQTVSNNQGVSVNNTIRSFKKSYISKNGQQREELRKELTQKIEDAKKIGAKHAHYVERLDAMDQIDRRVKKTMDSIELPSLDIARQKFERRDVQYTKEMAGKMKQAIVAIVEAHAILATEDPGTVHHELNVGASLSILAKEVGLSEYQTVRAVAAAMLHDIGKKGMQDLINKKIALTPGERQIIGIHPKKMREIARELGIYEKIPEEVFNAAEHHHDKNPDERVTKLLKIVDIADSLIGGPGHDYPLREGGPKTVENILRIMDKDAENGNIDKVLYQFYRNLLMKGRIPHAQKQELERNGAVPWVRVEHNKLLNADNAVKQQSSNSQANEPNSSEKPNSSETTAKETKKTKAEQQANQFTESSINTPVAELDGLTLKQFATQFVKKTTLFRTDGEKYWINNYPIPKDAYDYGREYQSGLPESADADSQHSKQTNTAIDKSSPQDKKQKSVLTAKKGTEAQYKELKTLDTPSAQLDGKSVRQFVYDNVENNTKLTVKNDAQGKKSYWIGGRRVNQAAYGYAQAYQYNLKQAIAGSVDAEKYPLTALGKTSTSPAQENNTIPSRHSKELSQLVPLVSADPTPPTSSLIARMARLIPTFQGGKEKMARAITNKIIRFFGNAADQITMIDDWFGGSGGWGGYLASVAFTNVKSIRVHEFSPERLEKIKLFHQRGREVAALFNTPEVKKQIDVLKKIVEKDSTLSGSGIVNRIDTAFKIDEFLKNKPIHDSAKRVNAEVYQALIAAMKDQGEASFGKYGQGLSAAAAVDDMVKRVAENASNAQIMFEALRNRGIKVDYFSGDSYATRHVPGSHVLSVIDPPYYATKGYNGVKVVPIETYNETRKLLQRVIDDGNSVVYTDEAWFDKGDSKTGRTVIPNDMNKPVDGLDAKGQLNDIANRMDAFFRTPIAGRIETVGFYNGTIKSNSSKLNNGGVGAGRNNQAERRTDTNAGRQPVQRASREVAEGSDGRTGSVSSDEQTGLKFSKSQSAALTQDEITRPTTLWHGTAQSELSQFNTDYVWLADNKDEAEAYASDSILNKGASSPGRVYPVTVQPGKVKDITDVVNDGLMNDVDMDDIIADEAKTARNAGFSYLSIDHPGRGDSNFKAIIALNPAKDLALEGQQYRSENGVLTINPGDTFYRATDNSPRGDVKGNAVLGKGVYITPYRDIAEIYGDPQSYQATKPLKLLSRNSAQYRAIVGDVDVNGTWTTAEERSSDQAKAIQAAGYDGVMTDNRDADGWVVFDKSALKQESAKRSINAQSTTNSTVAQVKSWLSRQQRAMMQAGVLKVVQSVNDLPANLRQAGNALFHTVFHGTPHDFDRFSLDKIGTGEGAQAFGFGLYFTDKRDIAEYYKTKLSDRITYKGKPVSTSGILSDPFDYALSEVARHMMSNKSSSAFNTIIPGMSAKEAIDEAKKYTSNQLVYAEQMGNGDVYRNIINALDKINPNDIKLGNLYQVELAPTQDEYLDWDKPLSEQSEKVKAAIKSTKEYTSYRERVTKSKKDAAIKGEVFLDIPLSGEQFYKIFSKQLSSDKAASDYLHSLGIRGIRYKAEGGKSDASNYVVFSEDDISITAKYSQLSGIEALYDSKSDTVYLVADMLNKGNTQAILAHELLHRAEAKDPKVKAAMERFESDFKRRFDKAAQGLGIPIEREAYARVVNAKTPIKDQLEEFRAYLVSAYAKDPNSIIGVLRKAFNDFVAAIRAFLVRNGLDGGFIKSLSAADLMAMSKYGSKVASSKTELTANGIKASTKNLPEKITIDGVERWTVNSDGKPIAQDEAGIRNFYKWFGDSEITDNYGKPLVVYHGTSANFNEFDPNISDGFWFTSNKDALLEDSVGATNSGRIIEAYLKADNLLLNGPNYDVESIRSEGYDGIRNRYEYGDDFAVLDPTQIKSTDNIGAFDGTNPDIRYSIASPQEVFDSLSEIKQTAPDKALTALSKAMGKAKELGMGALTQNQLVEIGSKILPVLKDFAKAVNQYNVTEARYHKQADGIAERWAKLPKAMMMDVSDMMHDMTVMEIDPRKEEPKPTGTNGIAIMQHQTLKARWDKLSPEAQAIINEAEKFHNDVQKALVDSIVHKIMQLDIPNEKQKKMIQDIESKFKTTDAPYFPLMRFGRFWVSYEGGVEFFESEREQDQFIKNSGKDIKGYGLSLDNFKQMDGVDAGFMDDVNGLIDKLDIEQAEALKDGIFQLYLTALPEQSMRKHFIHRKKTPGWERDALRSFSKKAFHDGKQLAKLQHTPAMRQALNDADEVIKTGNSKPKTADLKRRIELIPELIDKLDNGIDYADLSQEYQTEAELEVVHRFAQYKDQDERRNVMRRYLWQQQALLQQVEHYQQHDSRTTAGRIVNALNESFDHMMKSNTSTLTNLINQSVFTFFLGFNPASAIVNAAQTPLVAFPVIAGRHGFIKASRAMADAVSDFFSNRKDGEFNIQNNLKNKGERAMYDALVNNGTFDRTRSHDLAGFAEEGAEHGTWRRNLMNASTYMFHHVEVANREITALAAYRMEYAKTGDVNQAIEYADSVVKSTHLDYSGTNRPVLFQGNTARVMLQFKMYSQGMQYLWLKQSYDALKGDTPETKSQARKTLMALTGVQIAAAGVLGLPIGSLLMAAQLFAGLGDDDDDPVDVEQEIRQALTAIFGPDISRMLSRGVASETGIDFADRLSLQDLWIREPDKDVEGKDANYYLMKTLFGPLAGISENMLVGLKMMQDGNTERGLEKMLPNTLASALKAARMANDGGATSLQGNMIYETNAYEKGLQALGFKPSGLAEQQIKNSALKNRESAVLDTKSRLMAIAARAKMNGNDERYQDAMEDIAAFNERNPSMRITPKDVMESVKQRKASQRKAEDGIVINKKLNYIRAQEAY